MFIAALDRDWETVEFTSEAEKLISARGVASRFLICEPTKNRPIEDRIELSDLDVNRQAGKTREQTNQIDLPKAERFFSLPRKCTLHIDVCYLDVILWRDKCYSNDTQTFTVKERSSDNPKQEPQRPNDSSSINSDGINPISSSNTNQPSGNTRTTNTTTNRTNNNTTNNSGGGNNNNNDNGGNRPILDIIDSVGDTLTNAIKSL